MSFPKILGQEMALEILRRAAAGNELVHAYLFLGPDGVGKRSTAFWFAMLLNCLDACRESISPCGECLACRKTMAGNHPDVREILPDERTLIIKIEQIREILREAVFRPLEGRWKVFIVRDAQRMNDAAANCLLKLLEEPLSSVVIILLAPSAGTLLPTVVSRCQPVRFSLLKKEAIETILIQEKGIQSVRASLLSTLARGRPGVAIDLCQQEELWQFREKYLDLVARLPELSLWEILEATGTDISKEKAENLVELYLGWFRDLECVKEGSEDLVCNADKLAQLRQLSSQHTFWQLQLSVECVLEAAEQLRKNAHPRFVIQKLFSGLSDHFAQVL